MKTLAHFFLRSFGLGGRQPQTRLGRYVRRSNQFLTLAAFVFLGFQLFPQIVFANQVTSDGITVYARNPLPPVTPARLAEAVSLVQKSELAIPGRPARVFICNQPWLFRLFAPASAGAFATSMPMTNNIFVAEADLARNLSWNTAPANNMRTFSSVVAHEITHDLIRQRVGLIRDLFLPNWIREGYCDYIAQGSSFPEAEGLRLLLHGQSDPSPSFRYFLGRQMVAYLIDQRHLTFAQLLLRARAEAKVKAETVADLRNGALGSF